MMLSKHGSIRVVAILPVLLLMASCTAGSEQFSQDAPAGLLWGLWHGIISVISLIIHLFNDSVAVYEVNNTGGWYDFGFLLGVMLVWGGGCHASCKSKKEIEREKEWDELGEKVERKVMRKLKEWAEKEESDVPDPEWDDISDKVERKLKRKIREWAERD